MKRMKTKTVQVPVEQPIIPKFAYTLEEAAEALNIGRTLSYAMAADGRLRVVRLGRKILVPVTEIQAFLDREMAKENVPEIGKIDETA